MFKKSLLALAVTLGSTSMAMAGEITRSASTGTGVTVGTVGTCNNTGNGATGVICIATEVAVIGEAAQTTPVALNFSTATDYHNGDSTGLLISYDPMSNVSSGARVTFTLANGYFADEDYNLVLPGDTTEKLASLANTVTDASGNITGIELSVAGGGLSSGTAYTLVNAGEATADGADVAEAADTISIEFVDGVTTGTAISISASARDNLGALSSAAAAAVQLVTFSKQFAKKTDFKADAAVVDVNEERKDFDTTDALDTTGGDANTTTNATTILTNNTANLNVEIAIGGVAVAHTVTDSASFQGINTNATVTTGFTNTAKSTAGGVNLVQSTTDLTSATATDTPGDLNSPLVLEVSNDIALDERTVSMSTTLDYVVDAAFGSEVFDFGAVTTFQLNGSSDDIAILPFGSEYSQSITVTNTGTLSGAIVVDLISGGTTFSKTLTAAAAGLTVTNISKEVADFALASGITGNAGIKVVVNAPSTAIAVKAIYYHRASQDRVLTY
jgi:hypothetical protein